MDAHAVNSEAARQRRKNRRFLGREIAHKPQISCSISMKNAALTSLVNDGILRPWFYQPLQLNFWMTILGETAWRSRRGSKNSQAKGLESDNTLESH